MAERKDGGAFWWATDKNTGAERRTKNGDKYMTGKITIEGKEYGATLFYNKTKQKPRAPDIQIVLNEKQQPRQDAARDDQGFEAGKSIKDHQEEEIKIEDIPF